MSLFPRLALLLFLTCRAASSSIFFALFEPVPTQRTECTNPLCALSGSCNRFGCDACRPPGYSLDAQGTCRLSASLGCNDPRCLLCSTGDSGHCLQCLDGYGLDDTHACRKCTDPLCAVCGPPARCLYCQVTAYEDYTEYPVFRDAAGKCKLCRNLSVDSTNCAACNSSGQCTACSSSFYLSSGECRPCSDQLCDACPGNKCVRCRARARASEVSTKAPHSHYRPYGAVYMDGKGVCRLHPGEDDICYLADSHNRCRRCNAGHYVVDGVCKLCKGRDSDRGNMNCLDCSGSGRCNTCADGYGVNVTDPLRACVECAAPFCTRCATDHRVCTECANCVYTDSPPSGSSKTECVDMQDAQRLYFRDGRCHKCSKANCRDCFKSGACKLCKSGFQKINGHCVPCKDESRCLRCDLPFCNSCDGSGTACTACELGNGRDARCARCADRLCMTCAKRTSCSACVESTPAGNSVYRSSSGRCTECKLPGCSTCGPDGRCLACGAGYATEPVAGACQQCSDPLCAWCHWQAAPAVGAPQACDICSVPPNVTSTYVNSQGVCAACSIPGCLACQAGSSGACTDCMEGWATVGIECVACPKHCTYCQEDPGKPAAACLECDGGYSLDSTLNKCVPSAA